MADKKITELPNINGADLVDADEFVVVDISADETKAITLAELKNAFDAGTGFVRVTGDTMTGDLALSGADVTFGDNDKAIFGAGSDLQLFHDSSASYIKEVGAGPLNIQMESTSGSITSGAALLNFLAKTGPSLHTAANLSIHQTGSGEGIGDFRFSVGDGAGVLTEIARINSTGIDVTGTVTADGLTADAPLNTLTGLELTYLNSQKAIFSLLPSTGEIRIGGTQTNYFPTFYSSGSERMRIDASGNVGIGLTNPSDYYADQLVVSSPNNGGFTFVGATNAQNYIMWADGTSGADAYRGYIGYNHDNNAFRFGTSGVEAMRIDSSGNVGIGCSPSANLHLKSTTSGDPELRIEGTGTNNGIITFLGGGHSNPAVAMRYISSGNSVGHLAFYANGSNSSTLSERMRIDASGNVGIGESNPDAKLHIRDAIDGGSSSTTSAIQFSRRSGGANDAAIKMQHDGSDGVSNLQFHFGTSEAMRIDSSGNIQGSKFVSYRDPNYIYLDFVDSGTASDANGDVVLAGYYPIIFKTDVGHERMRLDRSGNLLVGVDSAVTTGSEGVQIYRSGNAGTISTGRNTTSTASHHLFYNPNGLVGSIKTDGSATAYNTSSDYRLKTDAQPMVGATARLKALNPVNFEWIADGTRVDGFLAHEAQAIVPEAVTGTKDAMMDEEYEVSAAVEEVTDDDGNVTTEAVDAVMGTRSVPDMQGIDQSKLVPLLVKTIQELEARITALEG